MRDLRPSLAIAALCAVCALATAPAARAAYSTSEVTGSACQLSIPTTDTKFRPKATGARNESTTSSNFVICPVQAPAASGEDAFKALFMFVYSIDGASHDVSCTAVTGYNGAYSLKYSSKTASVSGNNGPIGIYFTWNGADFGGDENSTIKGSSTFSVTCLLPPQVAINFYYSANY